MLLHRNHKKHLRFNDNILSILKEKGECTSNDIIMELKNRNTIGVQNLSINALAKQLVYLRTINKVSSVKIRPSKHKLKWSIIGD
jgi:hypothetical protein